MVQNFIRDQDKTNSLISFSLETETRPKLSALSGDHLDQIWIMETETEKENV